VNINLYDRIQVASFISVQVARFSILSAISIENTYMVSLSHRGMKIVIVRAANSSLLRQTECHTQ